jgi:hypothetical protein
MVVLGGRAVSYERSTPVCASFTRLLSKASKHMATHVQALAGTAQSSSEAGTYETVMPKRWFGLSEEVAGSTGVPRS